MKRGASLSALLTASLLIAMLMPIPWASADSALPYGAHEEEVYLPLAVFALPPTPTPTQAPPLPPHTPVESGTIGVLDNHSTYVSTLGKLVIVGEVQSALAVDAKLVTVTAKVFNGSDAIVEDFTRVYVDMLTPGERTCFRLSIYPPPAAWTHYTLQATWVEGGYARPTLSAHEVSGGAAGGDFYQLTGLVRNDGGENARLARAIGTLYGADGRVADCGYANTRAGLLSSGQESDFKIFFLAVPAAEVAAYRLQTDGSIYNTSTMR